MDCYQYFGNDLSVASNGDLLLSDGIILSQQRILRRLLTNPGDYIWDLSYGAGLPSFVGQPLSQSLVATITGLITSQMVLENSVAQTPAPTVVLTANQTELYCQVTYTDSATVTLQVLTFSVSA